MTHFLYEKFKREQTRKPYVDHITQENVVIRGTFLEYNFENIYGAFEPLDCIVFWPTVDGIEDPRAMRALVMGMVPRYEVFAEVYFE